MTKKPLALLNSPDKISLSLSRSLTRTVHALHSSCLSNSRVLLSHTNNNYTDIPAPRISHLNHLFSFSRSLAHTCTRCILRTPTPTCTQSCTNLFFPPTLSHAKNFIPNIRASNDNSPLLLFLLYYGFSTF